MFQLFGDEDDAELSSTGPSEAEMIKQRTAAAEDVVILEVEEGVPELQRLTLLLTRGQPLQKLSALERLSHAYSERLQQLPAREGIEEQTRGGHSSSAVSALSSVESPLRARRQLP